MLAVIGAAKEGQQTGLGKQGRVRADVRLEAELVRLPREAPSGRAGGRGAVLVSKGWADWSSVQPQTWARAKFSPISVEQD